ncbi:MAG: TraB/GumN family protein [Gammaproteobacteria bacterium]|nr:TraB/GumN family protein [Gammaproteobacteria bacterium]
MCERGDKMLRYLFLSLLFICAPALAAGERLLFYKLGKADAEVYLLGSMHLARGDIYPLRAGIMQAFAGAETLAVELDISAGNQLQIQQMILARGSYPAGESIRDHLSATTWRSLQHYLSDTGLPTQMLERMRPGLLVTTLSTLEMMKLGLSPELGIDRYFLEQARGQKNIHEMETIEQQIGLLLDFPQEDLLVRQTLAQLENMADIMDELVSAWKRGDAPALKKLLLDDELAKNPEFRSVYERMFDQRNRAMTTQVEGFLRSSGRYFVVVGAGHLVGDQGIISLLEKKGYAPLQL